MIKLFRNIRKNLITEGKTTNYLKYAIGEIVLVVIGILIALQINNWNEYRKDRTSESIYYCKFLEDVNQDQIIMYNQINRAKTRLHHANKFLQNLLKEQTNIEDLIFDMSASVASIDSKMELTKTAFEDLKSSGNLKIITDLELKQKLLNYYSISQSIMTVINDNNIVIGNRFKNNEDRINTGWVYLIEKQNGFDPTLINVEDLKNKVSLNETIKTKLINDALSYIGTSSRNLEHFKTLENEITQMKSFLQTKCKNYKDDQVL